MFFKEYYFEHREHHMHPLHTSTVPLTLSELLLRVLSLHEKLAVLALSSASLVALGEMQE